MVARSASDSDSPRPSAAGEKPPRPVPKPVDFMSIPSKLASHGQWLVWRYNLRPAKGGQEFKWSKEPFNPLTGKHAKSNDPSTWNDLTTCKRQYSLGRYDGVGFAFSDGDRLCGIDLDHVFDAETGEIDPKAAEVLERFRGTYAEISPGGDGVRIFCHGVAKATGRKNDGQPKWAEVYDCRSPRYLTVTGNRWPGAGEDVIERQDALDWFYETYFSERDRREAAPRPAPVPSRESPRPAGPQGDIATDDRALIERALSSKNGARFRALWEGDCSRYNNDHSSADAAFCAMLAYWTGKDADRMDRIFRASGLMRDKWDKKHYGDGRTYGQGTIDYGISQCGEVFKPRSVRADSVPPAPPLPVATPDPIMAEPALPPVSENTTGSDAGEPPSGAGGGGDADEGARPVIQIKNGNMVEVVALSEAALLRGDKRFPPIFQRSAELIRIIRTVEPSEDKGLVRKAGAVLTVPVEATWLTYEFMKSADYEKWDSRANEFKAVDLNKKYAETYISTKTWAAKPLSGIIEAPSMRRNGELISEPGYDEATGIFFASSQDFDVPTGPISDEDLKWSVDLFHELYDSFSPEEPHDFAAFVSAVLTALVRPLLPTAPGFAIRAPKKGGGKTKTAKVISIIALGRECTLIPVANENDQEFDKRMDAALLEGDPVILVDNIERPINSASLNAIFTSPMVSVRALGVSRSPQVRTNRTFFFTGNNLSLTGDLTRRIIPIDLNSKCEKPEDREFSFVPEEMALERRREFVLAALNILKRYQDDGCPEPVVLGSFEVWSRVVRSAVIHAGLPDPCTGLADWEATDTVAVTLRNLLRVWHGLWKSTPMRSGEVVNNATEGSELAEVLADICQERSGKFSTRILGKYLSRYVERREGGFFLQRCGTEHSAALFRVKPIDDEEGS